MAHGDAREGRWRGKWRMEWVVSTFTLPRNFVYSALLPLLPLMRIPRLPVVDWTDAPADLNGLVRSTERLNLVSARVLSHFKRSLHILSVSVACYPASKAHAPCCHRWPVRFYHIFPHYLINSTIKKIVIEHKMCFDSLYSSSLKYFSFYEESSETFS
jgi:hypothetical protein